MRLFGQRAGLCGAAAQAVLAFTPAVPAPGMGRARRSAGHAGLAGLREGRPPVRVETPGPDRRLDAQRHGPALRSGDTPKGGINLDGELPPQAASGGTGQLRHPSVEPIRDARPGPREVGALLGCAKRRGGSPHGANAANALGLTQQVPIREVYLTLGRSRTLQLGRAEVTVKHAPRWMLAPGTSQARAAVRALAWIGPTHVRESLAALRRTLPPTERQALTASRAGLPSWMARAIGEAANRG